MAKEIGTRGLTLAGVGGLTAAFCYVGTVVVGGAVVPGYSHIRRGWHEDASWKPLRRFSVIAAAAILVTVAIGAALVTSPVFGLLARLTQLSFLSWFASVGVLGLRRARR